MISLNPSGFACSYDAANLDNLTHNAGGKKEFTASRSRRGRFYNVLSCLSAFEKISTFWTFTIQKQQGNFIESDPYYSGQFQKLLEGLILRHKRKQKNGLKNFVWVSEAQERGNIHFHLVTSTPYLEINFVQKYWNKLTEQDSKNSVDVEYIKENSIRNISGYFAKYMSKGHSKNFEGKGLKARVIYCRSFGYSRNFPILEKVSIHRNELIQVFPDMDKNKVTKIVAEGVSIDYYFLNTEKVMEFIKRTNEENEDPPLPYRFSEKELAEGYGFI